VRRPAPPNLSRTTLTPTLFWPATAGDLNLTLPERRELENNYGPHPRPPTPNPASRRHPFPCPGRPHARYAAPAVTHLRSHLREVNSAAGNLARFFVLPGNHRRAADQREREVETHGVAPLVLAHHLLRARGRYRRCSSPGGTSCVVNSLTAKTKMDTASRAIFSPSQDTHSSANRKKKFF
jgi:hypothetical protein